MPSAPPRRANPRWSGRDRSREAHEHHRLYNTTAWRRARLAWLAEHPLCRECEREGRLTPATVVDHIIPHKGDLERFWASETNWQSLCVSHHSEKTAREEKFGR